MVSSSSNNNKDPMMEDDVQRLLNEAMVDSDDDMVRGADRVAEAEEGREGRREQVARAGGARNEQEKETEAPQRIRISFGENENVPASWKRKSPFSLGLPEDAEKMKKKEAEEKKEARRRARDEKKAGSKDPAQHSGTVAGRQGGVEYPRRGRAGRADKADEEPRVARREEEIERARGRGTSSENIEQMDFDDMIAGPSKRPRVPSRRSSCGPSESKRMRFLEAENKKLEAENDVLTVENGELKKRIADYEHHDKLQREYELGTQDERRHETLAERVTRNVEVFIEDTFRRRSLNFDPDLNDCNWLEHVNQSRAMYQPARPYQQTTFTSVVDQKEWREPSPRTAERRTAIQELLADASGAQVWRQPPGVLAYLTKILHRVHHCRRNVAYAGLRTLLIKLSKENERSDEKLMEFIVEIFELESLHEELPRFIPLLMGGVQSLTLDHRQIGILLAALFLSPKSGFNKWLTSSMPMAPIKIEFLMNYFATTRNSRINRSVTYRLLTWSRDLNDKLKAKSHEEVVMAQVENLLDMAQVRGCTRVVGSRKEIGQDLMFVTKGVEEEDVLMLESPQLILLTLLHPKLDESKECLSVVGALQYSTHVGTPGTLKFRKLQEPAGEGVVDKMCDQSRRSFMEHLFVSVKRYDSPTLRPQLKDFKVDVQRLLIGFTGQGENFKLVPFVVGQLEFEGKSNQELMFIKLLLAATVAGRPLLYHTNGDAAHAAAAERIARRIRFDEITLTGLWNLVTRAADEADLEKVGVFETIYQLMDQDAAEKARRQKERDDERARAEEEEGGEGGEGRGHDVAAEEAQARRDQEDDDRRRECGGRRRRRLPTEEDEMLD